MCRMKRELLSVSIGFLAEASQVKLIHKRNRHVMCALCPHSRVLSDELKVMIETYSYR